MIPAKSGAVRLVQVCETLTRAETRKRECWALAEAMRELGCKTATLVTRDEDGEETVDGGTITITLECRSYDFEIMLSDPSEEE